jgi:hypothetical protein
MDGRFVEYPRFAGKKNRLIIDICCPVRDTDVGSPPGRIVGSPSNGDLG